MRKLSTIGLAAVICGMAAGCAVTPDVGINYYLPKSTGVLVANRALRCDIENSLIVASSVTPRVFHSADKSDPWTIKLAELDSAFSNISATFQFFTDGRLKGVNTTSTGQGGEVLKAAIELASSVMPFSDTEDDPERFEKVCEYINSHRVNEDGTRVRSNVLTLTFAGPIEVPKGSRSASGRLMPTAETEFILKTFKEKKFGLDAFADANFLIELDPKAPASQDGANNKPICNPENKAAPVTCRSSSPGDILLKMRQPRSARIVVELGDENDPKFYQTSFGSVLLSQHGDPYYIPIPKAALFGKQIFSLAVNEAGVVTEVGYGKETGAAQALGVGQTAVDRFEPSSAADQAAAAKAEADLIAQQQRLARCRANPTTCQ